MTKGQEAKIRRVIQEFVDADIYDPRWFEKRVDVAKELLWAPGRSYFFAGYTYAMPYDVKLFSWRDPDYGSGLDMNIALEITPTPRP